MIIAITCMMVAQLCAETRWAYKITVDDENRTVKTFDLRLIEETSDDAVYEERVNLDINTISIRKKDGCTLNWIKKRDGQTFISATKTGKVVEMTRTIKGAQKTESVDIGNNIWMQSMSLSL